jgi:hypothetical protein
MLGAGVPSASELPKSAARTLRTVWTQIQEVQLAPIRCHFRVSSVRLFARTQPCELEKPIRYEASMAREQTNRLFDEPKMYDFFPEAGL